jgi:hypothetical protein
MGIILWQDKYIHDILHRASMSSCKPIDTHISASKLAMVSDCMFFDPTRFH